METNQIEDFLEELPHPKAESLLQIGQVPDCPDWLKVCLKACEAQERLVNGKQGDFIQVREELAAALEICTDIRMKLYLTDRVLRLCSHMGYLEEADLVIQKLEELTPDDIDVRFRILPIRSRYHLAHRREQVEVMQKAISRGMEILANHRHTDAWYEFRCHDLVYRTVFHDLSKVKENFIDLLEHADYIQEKVGYNLNYWFIRYLVESGNFLEDWEPSLDDKSALLWLAIYKQMRGETAEATRLIKKSETSPIIQEHYLGTFIHAKLLLAQLQSDWETIRAVLSELESLHNTSGSLRILLAPHFLALAFHDGRFEQAHRVIEEVDPNKSDLRLGVEWVRVYAARGDNERAARQLARVMQRQDQTYISWRFRLAYELNTAQLIDLEVKAKLILAKNATETPTQYIRSSDRLPIATKRPKINSGALVGNTSGMRRCREMINLLSTRSETVLITGETGTGKEVVAQALHNQGERQSQPFVVVNCAALPDSLAEAELFGYQKGAFTGADKENEGAISRANNGTLFLDEISSLPVRLQGLLLRVLETGDYMPLGSNRPKKIQARVIAATNEPLQKAVDEGTFRSDLMYRLDRLVIDLPPLRDRIEDIEDLSHHFMRLTDSEIHPNIDEELLKKWHAYPWPGNVRELRNEIERMMIVYGHVHQFDVSHSRIASRDHIQPRPPRIRESPENPVPQIKGNRRDILLDHIRTKGRMTRKEACSILGCSPNTARKDLELLQTQGLIERVHTSQNLRTSYFVPTESLST